MEEKIKKRENYVSYMQEFQYGYHDLHRLSLFQPPPKRTETRHKDALWVIYIHGGAWRDPTITDRSFDHTVDVMLSSRWIHKIKGFASLSYRLSPHPDHKQQLPTSKTSNQEAKHPDHINDILMGLDYLQENFMVGNQYILIGHSCGATLAFQTIMSQFNHTSFVKPKIIVGVAGIYNLCGLRDRHPNSGYEEFISGAFGNEEKVWDLVSPVNMKPLENLWTEGEMAILVSSTLDELVESKQVEEFEKTLKSYHNIRVETWTRILNCSHDDIWKKDGLVQVLEKVLDNYYQV
ncbi:Kynurenine formamidase [Erysiphe neolycopersici]|uniref:Kynurenine formamidase n=1 Tax=Erysiphe neolycopersici TaxID=212602 RepID=A0A420HCT1_9PEZI|nr:Kynurenine formamidase [Erysiphe neolycopersici]